MSAPSADPTGFEPVARFAELESGVPLGVVTADGTPVCLVRAGEVVHAIADRCSHQEFPLSAGVVGNDCTLTCAWHGATFDLATGAVKRGPAVRPIAAYDVRIIGEMVYVRPHR